MGYRVSGTLRLPDGTPANNAEIEFISRKNFSPLVQELKSNVKCGATGAYDVTLEYGEYAVIVYQGGTYPAALGTIILAADTVAGQDLPTLLQHEGWQPATPEYVQQIQVWLSQADKYAQDAKQSADDAASTLSSTVKKDALTSLGGELDPAAAWSGVPAHSDAEIGGPLNAQAEALAARTKLLRTEVVEALRRSYAEVGHNVVGTFQAGFTIASTTDVGIDLATGKGYTGPVGAVAAGTNPASGGFVDKSGELLTGSLTTFSGILTPTYGWPDMPAHSSPAIGQSLDVQAQVALDRTEFLKKEVLRIAPSDVHIDPSRRYFGPSGMAIESTDGSISGDAFIVRDDANLRWIMYFFRGTGPSIEVRYKTLAYATGLTGVWSASVLVPSLSGYHKLVFLVDEGGYPVTIGGLYHAYVTSFTGTLASKVIYHATASSLTGPWVIGDNVLPRGAVGSKDEFNTDTPYAIYKDGVVHLWYMGAPASPLPIYGFATRILKATSSNPSGPFTKDYSDVILPGTAPGEWDYGWLGGVQVRRRIDGRYIMVFNAGDTRPIGAGQEPATSRIGYAYSDSINGPWGKDYSNPYVSPVGTDTGVLENTNVWRGHLAYDHNYGRWSMFYNSGAATEKITRADMGAYGYTDSVTETNITGLQTVVPHSKVNLPAGRFQVSYQVNVIGDDAGGIVNLDVDLYLRRDSGIIEQSRVFVGSYPYENQDAILSYIVNMPRSGYVDLTVVASGGTILPGSKMRRLRIAIEQIQ